MSIIGRVHLSLLASRTTVTIATAPAFPPRQKPGSFSVEQVMEKLRNPPSSN